MTEKPILVLRFYNSSIIASLERENQYDDIPSLAAEICNILSIEVTEINEGPSERIVKFTETTLILVNNPYGSELRATSRDAQVLLKKFCDAFLEKHSANKTAFNMTVR